MNLKNLILGNITQDELLNYYNATIEYVAFPFCNIRGLVDHYHGYYFIYINKNLSYYKKKKNNITRIGSYRVKPIMPKG